VRTDVNAAQVATFFVAAVEGTMSMAKNAQDPKLLRDNFTTLQTYLAALRPPSSTPQATRKDDHHAPARRPQRYSRVGRE